MESGIQLLPLLHIQGGSSCFKAWALQVAGRPPGGFVHLQCTLYLHTTNNRSVILKQSLSVVTEFGVAEATQVQAANSEVQCTLAKTHDVCGRQLTQHDWGLDP